VLTVSCSDNRELRLLLLLDGWIWACRPPLCPLQISMHTSFKPEHVLSGCVCAIMMPGTVVNMALSRWARCERSLSRSPFESTAGWYREATRGRLTRLSQTCGRDAVGLGNGRPSSRPLLNGFFGSTHVTVSCFRVCADFPLNCASLCPAGHLAFFFLLVCTHGSYAVCLM